MLAPKRRIGGSGTSASPFLAVLQRFFGLAASLVTPFFISLSLLLLCSLCRLPLAALRWLPPALRRLVAVSHGSGYVCMVKGWDVGNVGLNGAAVLSWQPLPSKAGSRNRRCSYHRGASCCKRLLFILLGCAHLPQCVWAVPEDHRNAVHAIQGYLHHFPDQLDRQTTSSPNSRAVSEPDVLAAPIKGIPKHCIILQADFPVQHVLVYEDMPCTVQAFLQGAVDLQAPSMTDHTLHPTDPQIASGLASLVAVPDWMHNTDQTVYVLDFSFWKGPVFAVVDWRHVTLNSFAALARKFSPVPWQVTHGRQDLVLRPGATIFAIPGDVFRFTPLGHPTSPRPALEQLLTSDSHWDSSPSYIPREVARHNWLVLRSHVTRTPVYAGTSHDELLCIAAESCHSEVAELDFCSPNDDSPFKDLVYQGQLIRGVLAAEPRSPSGNRLGAFVFVDSRLLGLPPSFRYCPAGWVDLTFFTAFLALRIPQGYRLAALGVPCEGEKVLVSDRCTLQLRFVYIEPTTLSAAPVPPESGLADFGLTPDVNQPATFRRTAPTRFMRDTPPSPDPEEALAVVVPDPPETQVPQCCFIILSVDFQPEIVSVDLRLPCSVEEALQHVADSRTADQALYLDNLQPASPQPDEAFGVLLALPDWPVIHAIVVIDARAVDGRLFAHVLRGRFNRSSLIAQLGIADCQGLRVYLRGEALDGASWYSFLTGETIFFKMRDEPLASPVHLDDMLMDGYDWGDQCPHFAGPHFPAFRVLSDGGQHMILVDVERVRSFADFRQVVIEQLQLRTPQPVICSSLPRVNDLAVLGQSCKAILVASERVLRLPMPPGRLSLYTPVVFLDCRCILRGFSWLAAESGLVDLERLVDSFRDDVPVGYCAHVKGADTELKLGRPYLRVTYGTLLSVTFVADAGDTDESSSDPSQGDSSGGASATDDPTGADGPPSAEGPPTPQRDRSRSPRPHAVPPPADALKTMPPISFQYQRLKDCLGAIFSETGSGWRMLDTWTQADNAVGRFFSGSPFCVLDWPVGNVCSKSIAKGIVHHKCLHEPSQATVPQQAALAFLRYAAPRLGQAWRYVPPRDAPHIISDSETENEETSEGEPVPLHFVVLSPGFVLVHHTPLLQLPTTLNEAILQLQANRDPASANGFPWLVPANPQPCPGNGVVLALPAWCASEAYPRRFLCLDTSQINGRLFTAACPPYVSRRHLLHIAQLADEPEVEVHAGDDPIPISADGQFNVSTGDTFVFVFIGTIIPTLHSLALDLFSRQEWSPALTVPLPSDEGAFGLVHEHESILFTSGFERPTEMRDQIAACVGIRHQLLRVVPSCPRVTNASFEGQPCRTVAAIFEAAFTAGSTVIGALVDARPLLLGWRTVAAVAGRISCMALRVDLQRDTPPGWRVCLTGITEDTDFLEVSSGQVISAVAVPAMGNLDGPLDSPATTGSEAEGADGGSGLPGQHRLPTQEPSPDQQENSRPPEDGDGASPAGGQDPAVDSNTGPSYHACSFLLLGQNYVPEHVEVRLPVGIEIEDALVHVSAARAPHATVLMPVVQAVFPQPQGSHALCVTTPEWGFQGSVVAFDCRGVNGRLFSLHLVGRVDRSGLFVAAQIQACDEIDIYVGSQPWPLVDGPSIDLFTGELVMFRYAGGCAHVVSSLQDMLLSTQWDAHFNPAALLSSGPTARTWLMGDDSSALFEIGSDRQQHTRQDIATVLGVSSRELVIQPAYTDAPDFAHRGVNVRTILAALRSTAFLPAYRTRHVICFLDARPILLPISWKVCPDGLLDTGEIARRYAGWCPPGFAIRIVKGNANPIRLGLHIPVNDGEVFTILFQSFQVSFEGIAPPTDPQDDDDGDSDHPDDDRWDARSNTRPPASFGAGYPTSAADTGGTEQPPCSNSRDPVSHTAVKWHARHYIDAVLPGTWRITPVCLRGIKCSSDHCTRPAVCSDGACWVTARSRSDGLVSGAACCWSSLLLGQHLFSSQVVCGSAVVKWCLGFTQHAFSSGDLSITPVLLLLPRLLAYARFLCHVQPSYYARVRADAGRVYRFGVTVVLLTALAAFALLGMCVRCISRFHRGQWVFVATMSLGSLALASGMVITHEDECGALHVAREPQIEAIRAIPRPMFSTRLPAMSTWDSDPGTVPAPMGCLAVSSLSWDEGLDISLTHLHTLLEEAVWQPESEAFFLASTLIETLVEHFSSVPPTNVLGAAPAEAGRPEATRTEVCLFHALSLRPALYENSHGDESSLVSERLSCSHRLLGPDKPADGQPETFDLTSQSCQLPGDIRHTHGFFDKSAFRLLGRPPSGLDKPQRFRQWLTDGQFGRSPLPTENVVITTDGSFQAQNSSSGWGIVISLRDAACDSGAGQLIGCLYGTMVPFVEFVGHAQAPDAYDAEVAGLLWCAAVLAQLPFYGEVVVRADNISALRGAEGSAQMRTSALCAATRSLHAAVGICFQGRIRYEHVRGHTGEPSNELAHALAAKGAAGASSAYPFWLPIQEFLRNDALVSRWMPHLAMSLFHASELPPLREGVFTWDCSPGQAVHPPGFAMKPFLRAFPDALSHRPGEQRRWVDIRVATFNALSLMDGQKERQAGLHGSVGRPTLLQQSLVKAGVYLAGIQECRTPAGTMRCGHFTRYASGCDDSACFGNELWVHESGPCSPASVVVLHSSPTVLIASAKIGLQHTYILVGHAPRRGHSLEVRREWWSMVSHLCLSYSRQLPWLFLLDANCRVGSRETSAIGSHQADEEDDAGLFLHDLLLDMDLCVPSTFEACMYGSGGTLYQKRNGALDRSDYVCIQRAWLDGYCRAWTDPGITVGHPCIDHAAAVLECAVPPASLAGPGRRAPRLDAKAISDPANRPAIASIISSAPRPYWSTEVSEHAAIVVDYLYEHLRKDFPVQRARMRASFFSEETVALHQAVATLRHAVRSRTHALHLTYLRCAMHAWRDCSADFCSLFQGRWLWTLRTRLGHNCMLLRRFGRRLRNTCKVDKAAHLSALSEEITQAPSSEVHRAVQRVLRPRKYRKTSNDPLPRLFRPDGTLCVTEQEVADTWRDHFRVLEGGIEVSPEELVSKCRLSQARADRPDVLDVSSMPSWAALEAAFRHSAPRKAAGPDLIPPSICRAFSVQLTELFWPLLIKSICYSSEPVGMKGGVMFHINKGKPGSQSECAAHRGILAQSCLSKVFHRSLRGLIVGHWSKHSKPLQLGGKAGCSATFGHLCSRSLLYFAKAHNLSAGLLFVDLQSAYYAVIRETVLGGGLSDRPLAEVASALGLDDEDLQILKHYAEQEPVLYQQDAGPLLISLARELHRQTWFVLAEDPMAKLVETQRGTRPGGTLADVLFNVLFAKVLSRRRMPEFSCSTPRVPWHGERTPFLAASPGAPTTVPIEDIVYADDLCTPITCAEASQLRGVVSSVTADTMDVLTPHALRPNLGPTKTSAVFAPIGAGSRRARQEAFVQLKGRVPVWPESKGLLWLDLVPRYRHLGSIVTHDCKMGPEIRHRMALAASAFREGKRKLYACRAIPLPKRAALFRTHVLSILLSGAGSWPLLSKGEWQSFKGGVLGFYRQLLCLRSTGDWHRTEAQIFSGVGLPSPEALLHAERLRLLGQLVRSAPDQVWALLAWYSPYQEGIRAACTWLYSQVGSTVTFGPVEQNWSEWSALIRAQPGRWKGLIRRAEASDIERQHLRASFDSAVRDAWQPSVPPQVSPLEDMEHACLVCGLAFCTRQQWGAHAQRKHGYRNAASKLAVGRQCRSCGMRYATQSRLKTHLLASAKCRHYLEQFGSSLSAFADIPDGHVQAPSVRLGSTVLHSPERADLCLDLLAALQCLAAADDQQIYDLVASFVEPLPILRRTVQQWVDSLPPGDLADSAADVLLVLRPDLLCSEVCGKTVDRPLSVEFSPKVVLPLFRPPTSISPMLFVGAVRQSWLEKWRLSQFPQARLDFDDLVRPLGPCSGLCVLVPLPPRQEGSFLQPGSLALRALRLVNAWTSSFLATLPTILRTAHLGVPVFLSIPVKSLQLEPVSEWLLSSSAEHEDRDCFNCFTVEFNAIGTSL